MCGVVCIMAYGNNGEKVDRQEVRAIRDHMVRRGPDGEGEWFSDDGRIGMGHRRLSIIDLSDSARQPMSNEDGSLTIVFNGEIYNYKELRPGLEARGHRFASKSDTEVILHLYEEKGPDCVKELRGMFAFCLWDQKRKRLMMARDHYGIKPLYYSKDAGAVRIASQVKALLAGQKISRQADGAGVVGFFLWGAVPEPHTLYQAIREVEAGCCHLIGDDGQMDVVRYWSPQEIYSRPERQDLSDTDMQKLVRSALLDSVRHHLVADVPVGLFLSAGYDSSTILGLASEALGRPVQTVTLAFEEFKGSHDDESEIAQETAKRFNAIHTTIKISKGDFAKELPEILQVMDQPTIDGINTYFVARAAKQAGLRVALSGLGGDEFFGGYKSFQNIPNAVKYLGVFSNKFTAGAWKAAGKLLPYNRRKEKLRGLLKYGGSAAGAYFLQRSLYMPWELSEQLDSDLVREGLKSYDPVSDAARHLPQASLRKQVAVLEQCMYMRNTLMRDSDWAGMAHSVEIRVPFVDRVLAEKLADISEKMLALGIGKKLIAGATNGYLPKTVTNRTKTGFSMPMNNWLSAMMINKMANEYWPKAWARYCVGREIFRKNICC